MNKVIIKTVIYFFWVWLCLGCSKAENEYVYTPKTKLYPLRPTNSSDAAVIQYTKKLQCLNVDVITAGEGHLLVIPNNILFKDQTSRLTWESYAVLNQVIDYIKLYRTAEININDFVSPYGTKERQVALSLARASAVKDYLWSQNIDTRLVVSNGMGNKKPIYYNNDSNLGDASKNARLEIRFFELAR